MVYKKEKIKGYEEYSVDTNGVVYSKRDKPLKYSINHNGYCIVNLVTNGTRKGFSVHTLIAKQFITNNDIRKTQVNHKDGDKTNNCVDNLEWVTPKENMRHAVDVLGNYIEDKNVNARAICGVDTMSHKVIYRFKSLIGGARFFAGNKNNARNIQNVLWKALSNYHGEVKSYRKCLWFYEDECPYDITEGYMNIVNGYKPDRGFRKLSNEDIEWIRTNYIPYDKEFGARSMARKFGVNHNVISKIVNYKTYKEVN